MDITVIVGIVVAWTCVILCLILEGNKLSAFISLSSFLLVIGGSFGATIIAFKATELNLVIESLKDVLKPHHYDFTEKIAELKGLATQARRGGVLSLEDNIAKQDDEFIKTGIQLVIDGADSELIQKVLETRSVLRESRRKIGEKFFDAMGGYAPTLGIIGTVLGLVKTLGNLSEPEKLGEGIAAAFVATLYGIASANLIFLPLAAKIKANTKKESLYYEMIQEGILSVHAGENPIMLEEKLKAFVVEHVSQNGKAGILQYEGEAAEHENAQSA